MHLNGIIKRITDFGAFIVLDRTRGPLEGMCHKEEARFFFLYIY